MHNIYKTQTKRDSKIVKYRSKIAILERYFTIFESLLVYVLQMLCISPDFLQTSDSDSFTRDLFGVLRIFSDFEFFSHFRGTKVVSISRKIRQKIIFRDQNIFLTRFSEPQQNFTFRTLLSILFLSEIYIFVFVISFPSPTGKKIDS